MFVHLRIFRNFLEQSFQRTDPLRTDPKQRTDPKPREVAANKKCN